MCYLFWCRSLKISESPFSYYPSQWFGADPFHLWVSFSSSVKWDCIRFLRISTAQDLIEKINYFAHLTHSCKSQLSDTDECNKQQILLQILLLYSWNTSLELCLVHILCSQNGLSTFFFFLNEKICASPMHVGLGALWMVAYTYANENWEDN